MVPTKASLTGRLGKHNGGAGDIYYLFAPRNETITGQVSDKAPQSAARARTMSYGPTTESSVITSLSVTCTDYEKEGDVTKDL